MMTELSLLKWQTSCPNQLTGVMYAIKILEPRKCRKAFLRL